jgi:heme A synthase
MKLTQRIALTTCIVTLLLIGIGAFVRASGSGLGCPDWPTCHGGAIPPGSRHAMIEFSHRFTASVVGLLVIATAVLAWKYYRHVPFILWTTTLTVPLVGFQGILGAITVKRELPPEIVATHLVIAMCVFTIEIAAFFAMYLEDPDRREKLRGIATAPRLPGKVALIAITWLAAVMWIGGYMAESGASTACTGWPTCNGSVLPGNDNHEIVHMIHRYIAGLFVFLIVPLVIVAWKRRRELFWAKPVAIVVGVLYFLQVFVGALNVWYAFPDWLSVSHTVIAASIWGTLSIAIVLTFYSAVTVRHTNPLSTKAKVTA